MKKCRQSDKYVCFGLKPPCYRSGMCDACKEKLINNCSHNLKNIEMKDFVLVCSHCGQDLDTSDNVFLWDRLLEMYEKLLDIEGELEMMREDL